MKYKHLIVLVKFLLHTQKTKYKNLTTSEKRKIINFK
jgi:hypothetical protein